MIGMRETKFHESGAIMNLEHKSVIENDHDWVRFRQETPDTLDEILPEGEGTLINRLTNEGGPDHIWYVEFERKEH